MADFHQNGIITTHNLSERSAEDMEKELLNFQKCVRWV